MPVLVIDERVEDPVSDTRPLERLIELPVDVVLDGLVSDPSLVVDLHEDAVVFRYSLLELLDCAAVNAAGTAANADEIVINLTMTVYECRALRGNSRPTCHEDEP